MLRILLALLLVAATALSAAAACRTTYTIINGTLMECTTCLVNGHPFTTCVPQ
jgi:hypothetical protein